MYNKKNVKITIYKKLVDKWVKYFINKSNL